MLNPTILLALFLGIAQPPSIQERVYVCGVSFEVPVGWDSVPNPYDEELPCSVCLRPANWREQWQQEEVLNLGECALTLTVIEKPLRDAAPDTFFVWYDGAWFIEGRQGMKNPAESAAFGEWTGIMGIATVGYSSKMEGYSGLGEALRILVDHPCGSSVSVEGDSLGDPSVAEEILRSLAPE